MYLLKKVIEVRESSHPDHEKPFLEHLEDLRKMITRVVLTLLISTLLCFVFNTKIMDFFRLPVDQVLTSQIEASLPETAPRPLTVELWTQAQKVEIAASSLEPEQKPFFYQSLNDDNLAFHARTISTLRAAEALPETSRLTFIDSLPENDDFKKQVKALLISKPKMESSGRGNLNMMSALKPTEGFMLAMKLSFVAGIVISFPLLLYFILQFVLPGLHANEKKVMWPAMAIGFGLFLCGTAFAYYLVLPRTLLFFSQWNGDMGISNDWRIGEYISFATQFTLLFGASFELPVVVMVFVKLGLLSYDTMSNTRHYAVIAIFVAAAILTPTPDIATMCVMALPMIILYEICIWLAFFDRKKARIREEEEARERAERLALIEEKRQAAAYAADAHWQHDSDDSHHDDGWHDDYHHHEPPPLTDEPTPDTPPRADP